jgi:ABC-type antimicrobial peptide transport system permease subunit
MNLRGETPPVVYQPFLQTVTGRGQMALYVQVAGAPGLAVNRIRDAVRSVSNDVPLFEIRTLEEEIDSVLIQERLMAMLSTSFSVLALMLASIGLYGLLSFMVVQRTPEMAVRMALGAKRGDVVWLVMRQALLLVMIGVAIGLTAALAAGRLASSQISGLLFGVQTTDRITIAATALLLVIVAAAAAYIPARRASQLNPASALRSE